MSNCYQPLQLLRMHAKIHSKLTVVLYAELINECHHILTMPEQTICTPEMCRLQTHPSMNADQQDFFRERGLTADQR